MINKEDKKVQFNIIHEDEHLLVINKPSGVVVNISDTTKDLTIQNFIKEHCTFDYSIDVATEDQKLELEEFKDRSGILHRLDKDTSGVLLIAKHFDAFRKFKSLFKEREMKKEYLAIVLGNIIHEKMEIDAPIKRNPKNPMKFAVVSEGKHAVTVINKVANFSLDNTEYTALRVYPKTGRTHQIRVHLTAINHPIATDSLYLTRHQYAITTQNFSRLMLHAFSLTFQHPYLNEEVTYSAIIPEEFKPYF